MEKTEPIKEIATGCAEHGEFTVNACLVKLSHSYLVFITDQNEYGLGTITLGAQPDSIRKGLSTTPFNTFGLKNNLLSNLVTKTASKKLNSPVLSFTFIKNDSLKPEKIMEITMNALNNLFDQFDEIDI